MVRTVEEITHGRASGHQERVGGDVRRYVAVALYVPVQNVVKTSASKILPENEENMIML